MAKEEVIKIQLTETELVTIKDALQVALNEKCNELINVSLAESFGAKKVICSSLDYELTNLSEAKTKFELIIMKLFRKRNYGEVG